MDGDGHAATSLGSCGDDCNDNDNTIFTGATELCDGKDNNCNNQTDETAPTWYADCDGDGFAPTGAPSASGCSRPAPHSSCGAMGAWTAVAPVTGQTDCWDGDPKAHPYTSANNGNAWSEVRIATAPTTIRPFDFNCDGTEEKRYTIGGVSTTGICPSFGGRLCSSSAGYSATTTPACGVSGTYSYCALGRIGCERVVESRRQQCR